MSAPGKYAQIGLILATHPKARKANYAAMGLWLYGNLVSNIQEGDGFVDETALEVGWGTHRAAKKLAEVLCEVGLWSKVPHGYRVNKYEKWNRLALEIAALREADRERKAKKSATGSRPTRDRVETDLQPTRDTLGTQPEQIESAAANDVEQLPDNSGRNPVSTTTSTATTTSSTYTNNTAKPKRPAASVDRGTRITADWKPKPETIAKLIEEGYVDAPRVAVSFVEYWLGVPGAKARKVDWEATYRSRVREVSRQGPARPSIPAIKQAFVQQTAEELQRQRDFREAGGFE